MYLKCASLRMLCGARDRSYWSQFEYHSYVIGYSISNELRKLKIETDGTYDALIVEVGSEDLSLGYYDFPVVKLNLVVDIPFDFERYDKSDDMQRCMYYIEVLQQGLQEISNFKTIPYAEIMRLANELADNGFVYTWSFKNVTLRDYNLKVKFINELSTNDYTFKLQAFVGKDKIPVCEEILARTKPDSVHFPYISKKIDVENGQIIINCKTGEPFLYIDIKSLLEGYLVIEYAKSPFPNDERASEVFYSLQSVFRNNKNFEL